MTEWTPHESYRVRVIFRRGGVYQVKPEAEVLDGLVLTVTCCWLIDSGMYSGEWALMLPPDSPRFTLIASGDVEVIE